MRIDAAKCVSCLECVPYCPVSCMHESGGCVVIDEEECVDCGVCLRVDVCPADAIFMPPECFAYPRAIRMQFSDPGVEHPALKAWGRGTEEAKTNDVTGKFARGEYGILFEFGRPGTGTRFTEVQKLTRALCSRRIRILEDNPVHALLADSSGRIKPEFVDQKVLSVIVEIKVSEDELRTVVEEIFPLLEEVDTVVSVGLVTRFEADGSLPVIGKLGSWNVAVRPNAKINVGLGRPLVP
jgi:NAD-dependent dihydropyrimidine dehydrogenase PreA subunit